MAQMNNPENQQPGQENRIVLTPEQFNRLLEGRRPASDQEEGQKWWHSFGLNDEEGQIFSVEELQNYKTDQNKLSEEGRLLLKRNALKAVNYLFRDVDKNPDSEFQRNWNLYYHDQRLIELKRIFSSLTDNVEKANLGDFGKDVVDFLNRGCNQEIARERDVRELYHDMMGVWIKIANPEQLAQYTAQKDVATMVAPLLSEVGGTLVALVMDQYAQYLRNHLAFNKNILSPALFAKSQNTNMLLLETKDRERFKAEFKSRLEELKSQTNLARGSREFDFQKYDLRNIANYEDWEIDRAILYGMGIQSLVTLQRFEVLASADPQPEYVGSADIDKIASVNPRHRWRLGRGGEATMHIREVLQTEVIRKTKSFFGRVFDFRNRWRPYKIHEETEGYIEKEKKGAASAEEKRKHIVQESRFNKMLSLFGIAGWGTRAGWRIKGLRIAFRKKFGVEVGRDWIDSYKKLGESVGVGARFFFDADRAKEFTEAQLLYDYFDKQKKLKVTDSEREAFTAFLTTESIQINDFDNLDEQRQKKLKIKFKITTMKATLKKKVIHDYEKGKKYQKNIFHTERGDLTYNELLETKTLVWRGMNFYILLKRAPYDILCNIQQILPQILPQFLDRDNHIEIGDHKEDLFLYIDQDAETLNASMADKKKLTDLQEKVRLQWGAENIPHLKRIYQFYGNMVRCGVDVLQEKGYDTTVMSPEEKKEKVLDWYSHNLAMATHKAQLRNDIAVKMDDIADTRLADLLFSEEPLNWGLIRYFENIIGNEEFLLRLREESEFGDDKSLLGKEGFFYRLAQIWYFDTGHNLHPNTADVDWRFIFKEADEQAGGTTGKRLWGDMDNWGKMTAELGELDHILEHAAQEGDLKKVLEFHGKIHGLEGMVGEKMYENQYAIAMVVGRYFQEDWMTRIPFIGSIMYLIDGVGVIFKGESRLSLSKIHGTRKAMSMNSDALRTYFRTLRLMGHIPHHGQWSYDMLMKAFGVDNAKFVITEIIPKALELWGLFLLWKFISESLKEAKGEKR